MDRTALIIFPPRRCQSLSSKIETGYVSKLFTIEARRASLSSLLLENFSLFRLSVSLNFARLFAKEKRLCAALSIFFFLRYLPFSANEKTFNVVELFCLRCLVIRKVSLFSLCQESSPPPSRESFSTVFRVEDYNARCTVFSLFLV